MEGLIDHLMTCSRLNQTKLQSLKVICSAVYTTSHSALFQTQRRICREFCCSFPSKVETGVFCATHSEDFVTQASSQSVSDRQTDGQTDGWTDSFAIGKISILYSKLCWRSVKNNKRGDLAAFLYPVLQLRNSLPTVYFLFDTCHHHTVSVAVRKLNCLAGHNYTALTYPRTFVVAYL